MKVAWVVKLTGLVLAIAIAYLLGCRLATAEANECTQSRYDKTYTLIISQALSAKLVTIYKPQVSYIYKGIKHYVVGEYDNLSYIMNTRNNRIDALRLSCPGMWSKYEITKGVTHDIK